jgi:hypothetical protein
LRLRGIDAEHDAAIGQHARIAVAVDVGYW